MKQFKLRASAAGHFLSQPQKKADREAGLISQSARTLSDNWILKQRYNYYNEVRTDQLKKGTINEDTESIPLIDIVFPTDIQRKKNLIRLEDDFFTGEPDLILPDRIEEIKSVWDIASLFKKGPLPKTYFAQAQVYMHLFNKKKTILYYCLTKTPDDILIKMEDRLFYELGHDKNEYEKALNQLRQNHNVDNVRLNERVRKYEIEFEPRIIETLKTNIVKARDYIDVKNAFLDGL